MREIVMTAGAMGVALYLACTVEIPISSAPRPMHVEFPASSWRRTPRGWEQKSEWENGIKIARPVASRIHPVLVASFQALASIGGLLAFPHGERTESVSFSERCRK